MGRPPGVASRIEGPVGPNLNHGAHALKKPELSALGKSTNQQCASAVAWSWGLHEGGPGRLRLPQDRLIFWKAPNFTAEISPARSIVGLIHGGTFPGRCGVAPWPGHGAQVNSISAAS